MVESLRTLAASRCAPVVASALATTASGFLMARSLWAAAAENRESPPLSWAIHLIAGKAVEFESNAIHVRIPADVAEMQPSDDTPEKTLKWTDSALHAAKRRGRNRVEAEDDPARD
jgi:GGDEF domain-containing protein